MQLTVSMITLGVSGIPESVAFYRDTLQLELKGQSEGFAFFAAGPITIVLNQPLGRSSTQRAGAMEIVFPVESVAAAHQELSGRGCTFVAEPHSVYPGAWAATLTDPDGHMLTVFGPE